MELGFDWIIRAWIRIKIGIMIIIGARARVRVWWRWKRNELERRE